MEKLHNNLKLNDYIRVVKINNYINVFGRQKKKLEALTNKLKQYINQNRQSIINKSTKYSAKITSRTLNKIIYPAPYFNHYSIDYIDNLNAACNLKEIFENAVYIDTLAPMKSKRNNSNELGYLHFICPIMMNNKYYKALITVREKVSSKTLYIISVELFKMNNFNGSKMLVKDLFQNIKLWNYDNQNYDCYNNNDYICDGDVLIWNFNEKKLEMFRHKQLASASMNHFQQINYNKKFYLWQ